jgi:SMC interacting uncharacterized protein involved in chromosome segregation
MAKKEVLSVIGESINSLVEKPNDRFEARVTKKGNKVMTLSRDNGKTKHSITEYSNGTRHETKTTKR